MGLRRRAERLQASQGRSEGAERWGGGLRRAALRDGEVERQVLGEPVVPPDLGDRDPLQRVDDEHPRDQVLDVVGHVAGEREDAALDLLEEVGDILVVEGERATQ